MSPAGLLTPSHFIDVRNVLARYIQRLRQSPFVRAAALLAGSTAIGQGLIVAVTPILTRLYSPEDFGALTVYVSVLTAFMAVASLRYEFAVPLPRRNSEAINLLAIGLGLILFMCLVCTLSVYIGGDALVTWTETPALAEYLWLLPLSLFGAGLYQLLSYWALREKAYGLIGRTRLTQSAAMVATQLGVGIALPGAAGLIVGDVVGRSGGGGSLLRSFLSRRRVLRLLHLPTMRAVARRYRRFPLISSGASLLNTLGLQLPGLLIAGLYGPVQAGFFTLAMRIGGLPADLSGQAIGQVYIGQASEAMRTGRPDQVYGMTKKIVVQMGMLSVVLILISMCAPVLFGYLFGLEWQEAGWFLAFLAPVFAGRLVVGPVSQIVNVAERQGVQMIGDAIRCVAVVGAFIIPSVLNMTIESTITVYTTVMVVMYAGLLVMYLRIARSISS